MLHAHISATARDVFSKLKLDIDDIGLFRKSGERGIRVPLDEKLGDVKEYYEVSRLFTMARLSRSASVPDYIGKISKQ